MTFTHSTIHLQSRHKSIVTLRPTTSPPPSLPTPPSPSMQKPEPFPPLEPTTPPLTPTTGEFIPRTTTPGVLTTVYDKSDTCCPKCLYEGRLQKINTQNTFSNIMVVADITPSITTTAVLSTPSDWWNSEDVYHWVENVIAEHFFSFFIAAMRGVGVGGMVLGGSVWCGVRLVVKMVVCGWVMKCGLERGVRYALSTRRERDWWL